MPRLRRSDPTGPGIRRIRRGRGFSFEDAGGNPVESADLERIADLVIPPAWTDVWICPHANGHIQVTGYDDAGRKQYLYHPKWREHRDREKFQKMLDFAETLPEIRRATFADLKRRGLVRDRVLACGIGMLDIGAFRIGGEEYAEENESYGAATLLKDHLRFENGAAVFDYPAKSGQQRTVQLTEPSLLPTLRALKRHKGGPQLLAWYEGREWWDVRSEHLNDRIKEIAGDEFSAKDFRTWNGTVIAAVSVAAVAKEGSVSRSAHQKAIKAAVEAVADVLGNTPTIARSSYIDPRVFDLFDDGVTIADALPGSLGELPLEGARRRARIEAAVADMLGS